MAQDGGERAVRNQQGLHNVLVRYGLQRLAQADVDADQHGAQLVVGQHHAHGHLRNRHPGVAGCLGLQQFGVPRKVHARCVQGFLNHL